MSDPGFWDDFGAPADIKTAAVRKLAELKKETTERAASNPARYAKFSDRVKELIEHFNKGLVNAAEVLGEAEEIAKDVVAEDEAHTGSGLNERAYGVAKILERFQPPPEGVREAEAPGYGESGSTVLTPLQRAAIDIDEPYASHQSAPLHWQEKTQMKKDLRSQVRRMVKSLDLEGWQKQIPQEVEHYAVIHYRKP